MDILRRDIRRIRWGRIFSSISREPRRGTSEIALDLQQPSGGKPPAMIDAAAAASGKAPHTITKQKDVLQPIPPRFFEMLETAWTLDVSHENTVVR